jgi:peptidyl-dipeptidase A
MTQQESEFTHFLDSFVPEVEATATELAEAAWNLATTSSEAAAQQQARLETELRLMFSDREAYEQLRAWDTSGEVKEPLLARQLEVLLLEFRENMLPKDLIAEMSDQSAALQRAFIEFRPILRGKQVTDNDIRDILQDEKDVAYRKEAWEASKQVGAQIVPLARAMVALRNRAARTAGFPDYFQMGMELQELDSRWLFDVFTALANASASAFKQMREYVDEHLAQRFGVSQAELGPWAWAEPFGQEDPLGSPDIDDLIADHDVVGLTVDCYNSIGLNIQPVLERSDLYEREDKDPHAFCLDVDRQGDVRILANVRPNLRWLETMLHEGGHAVYDIGINPELPWLLRTKSHLLTTEAIAILMGQQSQQPDSLSRLIGVDRASTPALEEVYRSELRSQLIFSRWVLVVTNFEAAMYAEPEQDLNALWWQLVERYQRIRPSERPEGAADWAAKIHVALYPIYYHNYLLGQLFRAQLAAKMRDSLGITGLLGYAGVGPFLREKVFWPGNGLRWDKLVQHATGENLTPAHWAAEFH